MREDCAASARPKDLATEACLELQGGGEVPDFRRLVFARRQEHRRLPSKRDRADGLNVPVTYGEADAIGGAPHAGGAVFGRRRQVHAVAARIEGEDDVGVTIEERTRHVP